MCQAPRRSSSRGRRRPGLLGSDSSRRPRAPRAPSPSRVHEQHEGGAVRESLHGERDRDEAADPVVAQQQRRLVAARGDEVLEPVPIEVHHGEAAEGQCAVPVHEVLKQPLVLGAGAEGEADLQRSVHVARGVVAPQPHAGAQGLIGGGLAEVEAREPPVFPRSGPGFDLPVQGDVHALRGRERLAGRLCPLRRGRLNPRPAQANSPGGPVSGRLELEAVELQLHPLRAGGPWAETCEQRGRRRPGPGSSCGSQRASRPRARRLPVRSPDPGLARRSPRCRC